jgi:NADP-dependent 3-hydroxy acid dehydrogenase YdfG
MEMALLLRDKVCIITGAASLRGIGYATAELFAEHGTAGFMSTWCQTPTFDTLPNRLKARSNGVRG